MHPIVMFDEVVVRDAIFLLHHDGHLDDLTEASGARISSLENHVSNGEDSHQGMDTHEDELRSGTGQRSGSWQGFCVSRGPPAAVPSWHMMAAAAAAEPFPTPSQYDQTPSNSVGSTLKLV